MTIKALGSEAYARLQAFWAFLLVAIAFLLEYVPQVHDFLVSIGQEGLAAKLVAAVAAYKMLSNLFKRPDGTREPTQ
jgi:hypothetical protein